MQSFWDDHDYLHYIISETNQHNLDNISRTKAYENFYMTYPEIKWALLAGIVSRNAGWNMTDLWVASFRTMLSHSQLRRLFMTYERANWLIFSDAYPQLLVYQLSTELKKPLFYLLSKFQVSSYMQKEWRFFWQHHDTQRLMHALIINEQNVIQTPVIKQDYFKRYVFLRLPYLLQDMLLLNAIILPAKSKQLYGIFVQDFTNIDKRITLGKQIASIMLNSKVYHPLIEFIRSVEHTGSRLDYERFLNIKTEKSPILRTVYPVITHHDTIRKDWYKKRGIKRNWTKEIIEKPDACISESFYKRRRLMYYYHLLRRIFM